MRTMHTTSRTLALVAATLSITAAAGAQYPIETITYSIEWEKAVIAPGEINTATVWATITPDIGTTVAWNTAPGTGQAGALKAFGHSIFDMLNLSGGFNGQVKFLWVPPPLEQGQPPITIGPDGSIYGNQTYQVGWPINPNPVTDPSVVILKFEWLAGDAGQPYEVLYATKAKSAKVFIDVGLAAWVGESVVKVNGQGGFTVTPTPSAIALVVPLLMTVGRRRRFP